MPQFKGKDTFWEKYWKKLKIYNKHSLKEIFRNLKRLIEPYIFEKFSILMEIELSFLYWSFNQPNGANLTIEFYIKIVLWH